MSRGWSELGDVVFEIALSAVVPDAIGDGHASSAIDDIRRRDVVSARIETALEAWDTL